MNDQGSSHGAIVSEPGATSATATRIQRYRQAERAWWAHHGLEPTERFIQLASPAVRLRVLEVGSGAPVLFIHGTAGAGPVWAPLVRELLGFRCLLLDRPGWGLSAPVHYARYQYQTLVVDLLTGVLDALGVDRTDVVGGSIGTLWALRLAAARPSRVHRAVLIGAGPVVPQVRVPVPIRLLTSPLGAIMVRLPDKPGQLRRLGHGASLDAGRLDAFMRWRMALTRDTDSMRHERAMAREVVNWLRGYRPGLMLRDAELAGIQQPTLWVYGTADPMATVDAWRDVVGLLPRGELQLVQGGGHAPWLDDPSQVGGQVSRFFNGQRVPQGRPGPAGEMGNRGEPTSSAAGSPTNAVQPRRWL
jgi:pimeloyl-ACP methyl ester carboxylesterase